MSRGYIAIAQNSKVDYLKLAYALALSLKATQKENQSKNKKKYNFWLYFKLN